MYAPALNSAFVGDDYLLLLASRDMPAGDFLRAIWDPSASASDRLVFRRRGED